MCGTVVSTGLRGLLLQWLLWDIYDILYRERFLNVGVGTVAIVDDNFNRELLTAEDCSFQSAISPPWGLTSSSAPQTKSQHKNSHNCPAHPNLHLPGLQNLQLKKPNFPFFTPTLPQQITCTTWEDRKATCSSWQLSNQNILRKHIPSIHKITFKRILNSCHPKNMYPYLNQGL